MTNLTENQIISQKKYLYGHISPETAYVVEDYPWGFRLRTTIRYWIESKDSKNGGQRFVSQTINPKTGRWCEPKRSTYSEVEILYLNEDNHVKVCCLNHYSDLKTIEEFKETHWENLSEFQKDKIRFLLACKEVMKNVSFEVTSYSVGPVSLMSNDPVEIEKRQKLAVEQEEKRQEQNVIKSQIYGAVNRQYQRNKASII